MRFLLDTNICSAYMRRPARLAHRFDQHFDQLAKSTIVLAELFSGAFKHDDPTRFLRLIRGLLTEVRVLDFDSACAMQFGHLEGTLVREGTPVPELDLMIASVALVHDLTIVTHNTKDFQRVPNLRIEDWLES